MPNSSQTRREQRVALLRLRRRWGRQLHIWQQDLPGAAARLLPYVSLMFLAGMVLDTGFEEVNATHWVWQVLYMSYGSFYLLAITRRCWFRPSGRLLTRIGRIIWWFGACGLVLLAAAGLLTDQALLFEVATALALLLPAVELLEWLSTLTLNILHPALLFVLSFAVLIVLGTGLLLLPNATTDGISVIDALFTSTSAVCVTGLAVLDTGKDFTLFGQWIILFLIQSGGLGVLTFTHLFGLLFRGQSSFRNQLILGEYINATGIRDTFGTLLRIVLFTLLIELAGAVAIFWSCRAVIPAWDERAYFAIFHSISSFCNAGFSTLGSSLFDYDYRFNYPLHLVIALLFILGGLGYNVFINLYQYSTCWLEMLWRRATGDHRFLARPTIHLNTYLVLVSTLALLAVGFVGFYALEYDHTLAEHGGWGKVATAFFGSATPRTAGFNTVNTGAMQVPTILLYLLLMWIGASPGSTGGGIKTTTFTIGLLNIFAQMSGKEHLALRWREITPSALSRATAIVMLSLLLIGLACFGISCTEPDKPVLTLVFEVVSAYSTVGLSMGITAALSVPGKVIIVITMFMGRVGILTFLTGAYRQFAPEQHPRQRFPSEQIFIN
ncbi:MAG: potassium transporter TrkG [Bacteroidia bacterium]